MRAKVAAAFAFGCAAFLLMGCASAGGQEGAARGGSALSIRVANDLVPPGTIVVWIIPELGARRRLGTIPPDGEQSFSYVPGDRTMEYRLMAQTAEGREIMSDPFTLQGASALSWRASSRVVTLGSAGT
ncbi:MAG TPA: hypothetical protein VF192_15305 [Longimicrobiales bacterium]